MENYYNLNNKKILGNDAQNHQEKLFYGLERVVFRSVGPQGNQNLNEFELKTLCKLLALT